jgi:uncharacterized membrane protein YfhO
LTINYYDDTNVKGIITADKDGLLLTSIPYDKGWHVLVDSIEVTPVAFEDALISLDLSQGTHTIEFNYEPQGLAIGKIISISSLSIFFLITAISRCLNCKRKAKQMDENHLQSK